MLFRRFETSHASGGRNVKMLRVLMISGLVFITTLSADMNQASKAASDLAKGIGAKYSDPSNLPFNIKSEDLTPSSESHQTFDANKAKQDAQQNKHQHSVADEMKPSNSIDLRPGDALFKTSEEASSGALQKVGGTETSHTTSEISQDKVCRESGKPYPLKIMRSLNVKVKHTPKVEKIVRVCSEHTISDDYLFGGVRGKNTDFRTYNRNLLEKDPDVQKETIRDWVKSGWFSDDVYVAYKHKDDAETCNQYAYQNKVTQEEKWEEIADEWMPETQEMEKLAQGPNCRAIERKCVEGKSERIINGKKVTRDCWKDKLMYVCEPSLIQECSKWRGLGCTEQSQTCIQQGEDNRCLLWEKTYSCKSKSKEIQQVYLSTQDLYCFDGKCVDPLEVEDNKNFGEVVTKLSVFKEIKQDLEKVDSMDARSAKVFKGKCLKCQKNVCENVMYDCCGPMDGFTNSIYLSRCSEEEKELASKKAAGQCHYVGSKSNKLLGSLWTSSYTHAYCCFPSKFVRVLQQKAREQLKKSWGSASSPDCEGLTMDEVQGLRFDTMDLSEAYEEQLKSMRQRTDAKEAFQDTNAIRERLQKRMEHMQKGNQK